MEVKFEERYFHLHCVREKVAFELGLEGLLGFGQIENNVQRKTGKSN